MEIQTTRQLGQNKSCCVNPLLLFVFQRRPSTTCLFSNCSFPCPPIRIILHAEITICQNQIWNFLLIQDHILFSFNLRPGDYSTPIVYILQSSKRLYPPPCSHIFNPGHFNYCSGADRVNWIDREASVICSSVPLTRLFLFSAIKWVITSQDKIVWLFL